MGNFGDYKYVKTKKVHACIYCGRKIPAGNKMRNYHGLWEGDWQNWYACGFCEKYVEPEYTEHGECISGDEFNDWFYDSDHMICKKCFGNRRYYAEWDWIDLTHIKITCGDCGHEWVVEIPID